MSLKSSASDFLGRFREIVSDPLNLLIRRDALAGVIEGGNVVLHNGLRVPASGPEAYYDSFSDILVINRGVHEPIEEFVFQEVLARLPSTPRMLELGAYWGHYSMWLKSQRPGASVLLVEPEAANLEVGRRNFERNGLTGQFLQAFVGRGHFSVDEHLGANPSERLTILHADIQGFELEMLEDCQASLASRSIDYLFVSTHTQQLHKGVCDELTRQGYRVEISSDFDDETTSYDGFVFASCPTLAPVFEGIAPLSRNQIVECRPGELVAYLSRISAVIGAQSL
jgi:hypothetical protein